MNKSLIAFLALLAVGLIVISQSLFIVDQTEQAIVLQLGQPVGDAKEAGLHFKIPMIQDVRRFDKRVLSVDPASAQVVISSDTMTRRERAERQAEIQKEIDEGIREEDGPVIEDVSGEPIIVDTFARYRIVDPLQFLKTLRTTSNAYSRIENILNDTTRTVLGKTTLKDLLSEERTQVMHEIRERVNKKITEDQLGIEIVDVRIVRADLTPALRTSTVQRMISELKERATETRAKGEERALEIRSTAEKERTVLIAEAEREAQILRGQGDETAIKTYADAFNKDKDFYAFQRSMEAYRNTLADPETRLILSPDSAFFKHFQNAPSR